MSEISTGQDCKKRSLSRIKGFQEVTLIDWEGKIASIIFTGGCNFRCRYCHASGLVLCDEKIQPLSFDKVEEFLIQKKGWIDGVVISGGEPTLDAGALLYMTHAIRSMGLAVKVDTNGSRPDVIKQLLDNHEVDYIAMDIKAPLRQSDYNIASGANVIIEDIVRSKDMIIASGIDHEFRTTVVPGIVQIEDIIDIVRSIKGAKRYCIQQFKPKDTIDRAMLEVRPYLLTEIHGIAQQALEHLPNIIVREN